MTVEQRRAVEEMLRSLPLDMGGDVAEQRAAFEEMMSAQPPPADVVVTDRVLGGVPAVEVTVGAARPGAWSDGVVLYLHGGAYVIGSASSSVGLAAEIACRTATSVLSVDYRLAPEHPFPAAVDDARAAYADVVSGVGSSRVALAGESAGGGLVLACLVSAKDHHLAMPAAAAVMSPWADLTLTGDTLVTKAAVDPVLSADGLARRVDDYAAGTDPALRLVSPLFSDLAGLPRLLVQAGSHEVLLDDAVRVAARAASADVAVTLDVTPGVPHVFQGFAAMLDEGREALDRLGRFVVDAFDRATVSSP